MLEQINHLIRLEYNQEQSNFHVTDMTERPTGEFHGWEIIMENVSFQEYEAVCRWQQVTHNLWDNHRLPAKAISSCIMYFLSQEPISERSARFIYVPYLYEERKKLDRVKHAHIESDLTKESDSLLEALKLGSFIRNRHPELWLKTFPDFVDPKKWALVSCFIRTENYHNMLFIFGIHFLLGQLEYLKSKEDFEGCSKLLEAIDRYNQFDPAINLPSTLEGLEGRAFRGVWEEVREQEEKMREYRNSAA